MPYKILEKRKLADRVYSMVVEAPRLAKVRRAGQFVIVRPKEASERIPLTMVGSDPRGGVKLIFQTVGYTTMELASLEEGGFVHDLVGPLGQPTEIPENGSVVCVGGGIGTAPILPIASALKAAGNRVLGIIGARTRELLILESEMLEVCHELKIATDDGSYGEKGFVTTVLKKELEAGKVDHVYIVGPIPMMKACAQLVKEYNVPATASLNSIMIDGTGMCGGCRVTVGGKIRYTCVDGPEFPADQIDFDELRRRGGIYREYEHKCRLRAEEEGL
ncbi:sulfide/dihydroorotate dehydrogenase-like FAD/NAD-binding protein [bacterium]|nr:sulfide/dihydroorotate dehydrogenase-like FAD/NAD-binding protein [bacterium]